MTNARFGFNYANKGILQSSTGGRRRPRHEREGTIPYPSITMKISRSTLNPSFRRVQAGDPSPSPAAPRGGARASHGDEERRLRCSSGHGVLRQPREAGDRRQGDWLMSDSRWLTVPGAYNVRDLGGYLTTDGKTTRWRAFLRADSLHNLSESTKNGLIEYGVRTVIDLRRTKETVDTPNALADMDDIRYFHLNMIGDTNPPGYIAPPPDEWTTPELTSNIYRVLLDQRQDGHIRDSCHACRVQRTYRHLPLRRRHRPDGHHLGPSARSRRCAGRHHRKRLRTQRPWPETLALG